jgi:RNA-binding protein YlmH
MTEAENSQLYARLDDLIKRSERGEIAYTPFLSPSDVRTAKEYLSRAGFVGLFFLAGGFDEAERARVFLLPDYMYGACMEEGFPYATQFSELGETVREAVSVIEIVGSGFRELSHRDYLGSVLSLGIERDAVGDIALTDKFRAVAVTSEKMADFLSSELKKIANDTVKVRKLTTGETPDIKRQLRPINDTVASGRLDCIVSALTGTSREKAQTAIKAGLVDVDYRCAEHTDMQLTPPCTITVRGHGKYILREFAGETKKGRLRIVADKYV